MRQISNGEQCCIIANSIHNSYSSEVTRKYSFESTRSLQINEFTSGGLNSAIHWTLTSVYADAASRLEVMVMYVRMFMQCDPVSYAPSPMYSLHIVYLVERTLSTAFDKASVIAP